MRKKRKISTLMDGFCVISGKRVNNPERIASGLTEASSVRQRVESSRAKVEEVVGVTRVRLITSAGDVNDQSMNHV